MTEIWEILLLATVQGVAEFLPISSSGHVVILGRLLGVSEIGDLNIVLHVGTLMSILVYYRRRVLALLGDDRRLVWLLAVGTAPGAVAGVMIKKWGGAVLESALLAGILLIVTGLLLLAVCRMPRGSRSSLELRWWEALYIGVSQAAAILPGLSRSGATICAGMSRGLSPPNAVTYSFLLAIPIIAGGGAYEFLQLQKTPAATAGIPTPQLLLGAAVAFLVGLASLTVLSRVVERGNLHQFAWWCIPLGVIVVIWQLSGG